MNEPRPRGRSCARAALLAGGITIVALIQVWFPSGLAAQQPPGAPAAPVFRARTELVYLDLRVTDEQGDPVEDLRADEIEVLEQGEPRPVRVFQHIHEPREDYTVAARRTIAGDVSTNRGAPRGHLYVLVFDQHHITSGNEQRARLAAERFLRTRLRPVDRVALYAIPGPGPQLPFTNQIDLAVAQLARIRGSLERVGQGALGTMRLYEAYEIVRGNLVVLDRVADRLASQSGGSDVVGPIGTLTATGASPNDATFQLLVAEDARRIVARADEDARTLLLNLSDLVRGLGRIEGRKNIVLFSEGFFADHVTRELEQVAAAAAESYSVIYAADLNRRELDFKQADPLGGEQYDETQSRLASLGSLATETGGGLLVDAATRLDQIFTRLADTSEDYYLVGFEPPEDARRDRQRYRRVTVRVRRDGVRASTRTGYALQDDATPADRRRAIDQALAAPFALQGLGLEYTTYVLRGTTPGTGRVVLSLTADLPVAAQGAGHQTAQADVVFVVRSLADGRVAASGTGQLPLPSSPRDDHRTTAPGHYRVQFELPPGEYLMRVVVREPGGQVGSADRHVRVPATSGPGVAASDLIVRSTRSGAFPVRAGCSPSEALTGMMELYARVAEDLQDLEVAVELTGPGERPQVRWTSAVLLDTVEDSLGPKRVAEFELPLEGTTPGRYLVRATVRRQGALLAQRTREIEILDGAGPILTPSTAPAAAANAGAPAFDPEMVLGGEVARQYLAALRQRTVAPSLERAVHLAETGAWSEVEATVGTPGREGEALAWILVGLARFASRDYETAVAYLKRGFEDDPTDARAAFLLGWAAMAVGDLRQAASAWRSAAYLDPTLVAAHLALADVYVRLDQPALARQALRTGLAALPGSPELLDRLSQLERR